jgi:hypothetical protein
MPLIQISRRVYVQNWKAISLSPSQRVRRRRTVRRCRHLNGSRLVAPLKVTKL